MAERIGRRSRLQPSPGSVTLAAMTHYTRADLHMADRHIAEGEAHVGRQQELITRLRGQALPTEEAEKLLGIFDSAMVQHRVHRAAIIKALEACGL